MCLAYTKYSLILATFRTIIISPLNMYGSLGVMRAGKRN